jgi:hypothetical protein
LGRKRCDQSDKSHELGAPNRDQTVDSGFLGTVQRLFDAKVLPANDPLAIVMRSGEADLPAEAFGPAETAVRRPPLDRPFLVTLKGGRVIWVEAGKSLPENAMLWTVEGGSEWYRLPEPKNDTGHLGQ